MRREDFECRSRTVSIWIRLAAKDDPPEKRTAASTAIENGGSISKKSSNTEVAEDAANRNQKEVPDHDLPCLQPGASFHRFSQHLRQKKREYSLPSPKLQN